MDGRREAERDVLESILVLLLSLAGLADRAAGLPLSLQMPVLGFLAHAEAVARSFLIGLPCGAPAAVLASRAADRAERLAADFRLLARLLRAVLAWARRRGRRPGREAMPSTTRGTAHPQGRPVPALPAPDTS